MKTKFTPTREFVPVYNDNATLPPEEQLKYAVGTLDMGDLLDLQENVRRLGIQAGPDGTVDTTKLDFEQQRKFLLSGGKYIPQYFKSIGAALLAADGTTISLEAIAATGAFIGLASELLWTLLLYSMPNEFDVKN